LCPTCSGIVNVQQLEGWYRCYSCNQEQARLRRDYDLAIQDNEFDDWQQLFTESETNQGAWKWSRYARLIKSRYCREKYRWETVCKILVARKRDLGRTVNNRAVRRRQLQQQLDAWTQHKSYEHIKTLNTKYEPWLCSFQQQVTEYLSAESGRWILVCKLILKRWRSLRCVGHRNLVKLLQVRRRLENYDNLVFPVRVTLWCKGVAREVQPLHTEIEAIEKDYGINHPLAIYAREVEQRATHAAVERIRKQSSRPPKFGTHGRSVTNTILRDRG